MTSSINIYHSMKNHFPLLSQNNHLKIKQLVQAGQTPNLTLAYQLLQGQGFQRWQALSFISYYLPIQRKHRLGVGEGYIDYNYQTLWTYRLDGVDFELIEESEILLYLKTCLLINDKFYYLGTEFTDRKITRQQRDQKHKEVLLCYLFEQQDFIESLWIE
ncbi:hypothetical protein BKI52_43750 [marine bacterium AO1-C]|nr:hypothetical protein BKI52_43750 [marine bacterium AO1-C]